MYFIGMDGGGTKTKCVVTDEKMSVIFESKGSASNFLIQGIEKVSEMIADLIIEAVNTTNIKYAELKGFVIGTTGAGRRTDAERRKTGCN